MYDTNGEKKIDNLKEDKPKKTRTTFKHKECKVMRYVKNDNAIEVLFDGYGLRFDGLKKSYDNMETVNIKYKGEIGEPNFICKLED